VQGLPGQFGERPVVDQSRGMKHPAQGRLPAGELVNQGIDLIRIGDIAGMGRG
jgi:hypothetical protein